jgi:hypothetical protein
MDEKILTITMDSHTLKSFLTILEQKQIPFAAAKALTVTAQEAQVVVRQGLTGKFILRNKWVNTGIIYQRAEKADWPNTQAIIGSRDEFMIKQEEGGSVAPKNRRHAIPVAARPSKNQLIPKKMQIQNLNINFKLPQGGRPVGSINGSHRTPQPFVAFLGNNKMGVYLRTGNHHEVGGREVENFKLLYRLEDKPSKYIKKEWLEKYVTVVVKENMQDNFERAMAEAMQSAR